MPQCRAGACASGLMALQGAAGTGLPRERGGVGCGVTPADTPSTAMSPCMPQQRGARIYLHRLARCRSSAHPPCRCGSARPPAGSRAGRCSHSGNPSARLPSTRRSPAAPPAARGTGFLPWREHRGQGSGCCAGRAQSTGRGCLWQGQGRDTHVGSMPSRTSGGWAGTARCWDPPGGSHGCSSARSVCPGCCGTSCPVGSSRWPLRGGC